MGGWNAVLAAGALCWSSASTFRPSTEKTNDPFGAENVQEWVVRMYTFKRKKAANESFSAFSITTNKNNVMGKNVLKHSSTGKIRRGKNTSRRHAFWRKNEWAERKHQQTLRPLPLQCKGTRFVYIHSRTFGINGGEENADSILTKTGTVRENMHFQPKTDPTWANVPQAAVVNAAPAQSIKSVV